MAGLLLRWDDKKFALDGARLKVGRLRGKNDICIPTNGVSGEHCLINNGVICDAKSSNGTLLNGVELVRGTKHQLKAGDVLQIDQAKLTIESDGTAPPPPAAADADGKASGPLDATTQVHANGKDEPVLDDSTAPTANLEQTVKGLSLADLKQQHAASAAAAPVATPDETGLGDNETGGAGLLLRWGERKFALAGARLKIGRAKGNDIIITDPTVSSNHLLISNGFAVDAKSSAGTQLNDADCEHGKRYRLKAGDVITITNNKLYIDADPAAPAASKPAAAPTAAAAAAGGGADDPKRAARIAELKPKREKVMAEIADTERIYSEHLKFLVTHYMKPLHMLSRDSRGELLESDVGAVFSNIESIANFHEFFLAELTKTGPHPTSVLSLTTAFLKLADFMKMYSAYVNNYELSIKTLAKFQNSKKFQTFLAERRAQAPAHRKGQDLMSYLIMPVQRIPRYELLLKELHRHVDDSEVEASVNVHTKLQDALTKIMAIAKQLNENKRKAERMLQLLEIQAKISGAGASDELKDGIVAPHRELIREGELAKKGGMFGDKPKRVFLFNDMLLWTNPGYKITGHVPLSAVTVLSKDDKAFEISHGPTKTTLVLSCPDAATKDTWLRDIDAAIKAAVALEYGMPLAEVMQKRRHMRLHSEADLHAKAELAAMQAAGHSNRESLGSSSGSGSGGSGSYNGEPDSPNAPPRLSVAMRKNSLGGGGHDDGKGIDRSPPSQTRPLSRASGGSGSRSNSRSNSPNSFLNAGRPSLAPIADAAHSPSKPPAASPLSDASSSSSSSNGRPRSTSITDDPLAALAAAKQQQPQVTTQSAPSGQVAAAVQVAAAATAAHATSSTAAATSSSAADSTPVKAEAKATEPAKPTHKSQKSGDQSAPGHRTQKSVDKTPGHKKTDSGGGAASSHAEKKAKLLGKQKAAGAGRIDFAAAMSMAKADEAAAAKDEAKAVAKPADSKPVAAEAAPAAATTATATPATKPKSGTSTPARSPSPSPSPAVSSSPSKPKSGTTTPARSPSPAPAASAAATGSTPTKPVAEHKRTGSSGPKPAAAAAAAAAAPAAETKAEAKPAAAAEAKASLIKSPSTGGLPPTGKHNRSVSHAVSGPGATPSKAAAAAAKKTPAKGVAPAHARNASESQVGASAGADGALAAANEALAGLTRTEINMLKGMKSPTPIVRHVLEATALLLGVQASHARTAAVATGKPPKLPAPGSEDAWGGATTMLAMPGLLNKLSAFDAHSVPADRLAAVRVYADDQHTVEKVTSGSSAAGCLWRWVLAVLKVNDAPSVVAAAAGAAATNGDAKQASSPAPAVSSAGAIAGPGVGAAVVAGSTPAAVTSVAAVSLAAAALAAIGAPAPAAAKAAAEPAPAAAAEKPKAARSPSIDAAAEKPAAVSPDAKADSKADGKAAAADKKPGHAKKPSGAGVRVPLSARVSTKPKAVPEDKKASADDTTTKAAAAAPKRPASAVGVKKSPSADKAAAAAAADAKADGKDATKSAAKKADPKGTSPPKTPSSRPASATAKPKATAATPSSAAKPKAGAAAAKDKADGTAGSRPGTAKGTRPATGADAKDGAPKKSDSLGKSGSLKKAIAAATKSPSAAGAAGASPDGKAAAAADGKAAAAASPDAAAKPAAAKAGSAEKKPVAAGAGSPAKAGAKPKAAEAKPRPNSAKVTPTTSNAAAAKATPKKPAAAGAAGATGAKKIAENKLKA